MIEIKLLNMDNELFEKKLIEISETKIKMSVDFLQQGKTMDALCAIKQGFTDLYPYKDYLKARCVIQTLESIKELILIEKRIDLSTAEMIASSYSSYPKEIQKLMIVLLGTFFDLAPLDEKVKVLHKIQLLEDAVLWDLFS